MRIAYVCQPYPPIISGAATVVQRLAKEMASRGHEVLVLAASDRRQAYTVEEHNLRVVRLHSYPIRAAVDQHFIVWPLREITAQLRDFQPGILHLHDPTTAGLCSLLAAKTKEIPVVLTIHQLPWYVSTQISTMPFIRRSIEAGLWAYGKWLRKHCHATITPTQTIADIVAQQGGFHPFVVSNAVDTELFSPRPTNPRESEILRAKYGLQPKQPVILHVGRISTEKQVELVVRASAQAMRSTQAQLLIVGDGRKQSQVKALCRELGIESFCRFPGFVSPDGDLPGIYRLASVFITASEIETQGLVALEALASGLPVLAPNAGALPEVVKDGINGYLFPPGDVPVMADRLVALLQDSQKAKKFGQAGRELVRSHALAKMSEAHEQIYRLLIEQPHKQVLAFADCELKENTVPGGELC